MIDDRAARRAMGNRALTRASQVLNGIVAGILADGQLHDLEVTMLRTWLAQNADVTTTWPGNAIARLIDEVLHDGVIDEPERAHLVETLQQVCSHDFAATGSAAAEVGNLPFDEDSPIDLRDRTVCHTGEFIYGTRKACEALTIKAGGSPVSTVSRKLGFLVVGSHVSPHWITESYGRKIMQAIELRDQGAPIAIVREQRWLESLNHDH